jgi:hypothetical protein
MPAAPCFYCLMLLMISKTPDFLGDIPAHILRQCPRRPLIGRSGFRRNGSVRWIYLVEFCLGFCLGFGTSRLTKRSPLQSSISCLSTNCLVFSIASTSSEQVNIRDPTKCPSRPTVYARYSAMPCALRPSELETPMPFPSRTPLTDFLPCLSETGLANGTAHAVTSLK